jgi:chemotaxis protein histidine kinase CheA
MTDGPPTSDNDRRFAALKHRFALGLAIRRDELAHAWANWVADTDIACLPGASRESQSRDALAACLHRLAGSAGAYGFDALGRLAHDLENQVCSPDAVAGLVAARFSALLQELSVIADGAAANT